MTEKTRKNQIEIENDKGPKLQLHRTIDKMK